MKLDIINLALGQLLLSSKDQTALLQGLVNGSISTDDLHNPNGSIEAKNLTLSENLDSFNTKLSVFTQDAKLNTTFVVDHKHKTIAQVHSKTNNLHEIGSNSPFEIDWQLLDIPTALLPISKNKKLVSGYIKGNGSITGLIPDNKKTLFEILDVIEAQSNLYIKNWRIEQRQLGDVKITANTKAGKATANMLLTPPKGQLELQANLDSHGTTVEFDSKAIKLGNILRFFSPTLPLSFNANLGWQPTTLSARYRNIESKLYRYRR